MSDSTENKRENLFFWLVYLLLILLLGNTNLFGSDNTHFYLLTGCLLVFNSINLYISYKEDKRYFFIQPIFVGTLVTFMLAAGGITNFLQMENGKFVLLEVQNQVLLRETIWLKKAMTYILIANLFTWIGYKLPLGRHLFIFWMYILKYKRLLEAQISNNKIIVLMIIAYLIKFYLFSVGLHGRINSSQYFEAGVGFKAGSQIRILGELSVLTYIIITYYYLKYKTRLYKILFIISFSLEIFFAFVYGARSPIIMVFLLFFVVYYFVNQRVNYKFLITIPLIIILAFSVVLDYKNYALSKAFERQSNPIDQFKQFLSFRSKMKASQVKVLDNNFKFVVLGSFNSVANTAMAIRHKTIKGFVDNDPNFIKELALFPYNAFIPKFLQSVKNEFPWGMWFKDRVLKLNVGLKYSISITPVGFLYFAGNGFAIIIGFLLYGILLKFTNNFLHYGIFSFVLYLLFISILYNYDSVVSGTMVNFTRVFFIYPVILILLLKK